jgi:hypothetical protein
MNYNYCIAAIVIEIIIQFLVSACLMIIMLFNCKFYNICILNRYLYTEYDNVGLTLKDLAINKVNSQKDNRPFDRLERALLN